MRGVAPPSRPGRRPRRRTVEAARRRCSTSSRAPGTHPDDGHLGDARRPAALHALQGDGVARRSTRGEVGGALRPRRTRRPLARTTRDEIHDQILNEGYDPELGASRRPTARSSSTPRCSRSPRSASSRPTDERMVGTVAAIERELMQDGFVLRYRERHRRRRPPARRGRIPALLVLARVDNYVLQGREKEARRCSSGSRPSRTTSACSPRSTTRRQAPARQRAAGVHASGVRAGDRNALEYPIGHASPCDRRRRCLSTTTSSSSAPVRAAARSPTRSRHRGRRSCCSSEATSSPVR